MIESKEFDYCNDCATSKPTLANFAVVGQEVRVPGKSPTNIHSFSAQGAVTYGSVLKIAGLVDMQHSILVLLSHKETFDTTS